MATVELTKIEEHPGGRILFRARLRLSAAQIEFPLGVDDKGSTTLNESAAFRSLLGFAEELAASVRLHLGVQP
jgi:hypothetical protein